MFKIKATLFLLVNLIFWQPLAGVLLPANATFALRSFDEKITLNVKGNRGSVSFNHRLHEKATPSSEAAGAKAACAACHHTRNSLGIPQLWKCRACHLGAGNIENPRNKDSEELNSERAFHAQCVSCHQTESKGPVACNDCHKKITN